MTVPEVRFPGIATVRPVVECVVDPTRERVKITGEKAILSGSPIVEALNGRFKFKVVSEMTWRTGQIKDALDGGFSLTVATDVHTTVDPPPVFRVIPRPVLENTGVVRA